MSGFVAISSVLASASQGTVAFFCKGCDAPHVINIGGNAGPVWGFNGNHEKPTFTPSVLVQWEQGEPPCEDLDMAEKILSGEVVQTKVKKVCHSFVTDGRIQYLGDCTHMLSGQTVDLPSWEECMESW